LLNHSRGLYFNHQQLLVASNASDLFGYFIKGSKCAPQKLLMVLIFPMSQSHLAAKRFDWDKFHSPKLKKASVLAVVERLARSKVGV